MNIVNQQSSILWLHDDGLWRAAFCDLILFLLKSTGAFLFWSRLTYQNAAGLCTSLYKSTCQCLSECKWWIEGSILRMERNKIRSNSTVQFLPPKQIAMVFHRNYGFVSMCLCNLCNNSSHAGSSHVSKDCKPLTISTHSLPFPHIRTLQTIIHLRGWNFPFLWEFFF